MDGFQGDVALAGMKLKNLLGTKLKALYQRKKGRDLFDMYWALKHLDIDTDKVIHCYKVHMENAVSKPPTQKQFLMNMNDKMSDKEFLEDIRLVLKQGVEYDNEEALKHQKATFSSSLSVHYQPLFRAIDYFLWSILILVKEKIFFTRIIGPNIFH